MRFKFIPLFIFAAAGLAFAAFNIYNSTRPPQDPVEKTVILAGQDLPVAPGSLGVKTAAEVPKKTAKPIALKDKVVTSESFAPQPSLPSPTIKVTNKGDNLLVLINKEIRLHSSYYPKDLVDLDKSIKTSYGSNQLRKEAAAALLKLFKAAEKKGFSLNVNSAYRSYQTQVATYNYWVSQVGVAQADRFSARPGHSQHQLGTTVDITSASVSYKLMESFGNTTEGKWLAANAYKYGFVLSYPKGFEGITGYTYEPWHFRYIGVGNAKKWKNSGLILETFLQKFGTW